MARTTTSAWLDAMTRATAKPILLVEIDIGSGTTFTCASGSFSEDSDLYGTDVAIEGGGAVDIKVNPVTCEVEEGEYYIDFSDAWLRPIIINHRVTGKTISCWTLGANNNDADKVLIFTGLASKPFPDAKDKKITIKCSGYYEALKKGTVFGAWFKKHPLEVLYSGDGKGILERAGIEDFDTDSFSISDSDYATISHFIIGAFALYRYNDGDAEAQISTKQDSPFEEPQNAYELIQSVCKLLNGVLIFDEEGKACFKWYLGSVVDSWTVDDIMPGSFKQDPSADYLVNQVTIKYFAAFQHERWVFLRDLTSQANFAPDNLAHRIAEFKLETPWVGGAGTLRDSLADDDMDPTITCSSYFPALMCGVDNSGVRAVSSTRPVYLHLTGMSTTDAGTAEVIGEVVKAETLSTSRDGVLNIWDPDTKQTSQQTLKHMFEYTDVTREQLETSAIALQGYESTSYGEDAPLRTAKDILDITVLAYLTNRLFERFSTDPAVVEVETPLSKANIQIYDVIQLTLPDFVAYSMDGVTTATNWLVIGKAVDVLADPPVCRWRLLQSVSTKGTVDVENWETQPIGPEFYGLNELREQELSPHFDGCDITPNYTDALEFDLDPGFYKSMGKAIYTSGKTSFSLTANKDSYVCIDRFGTVKVIEETIGNNAPELAKGESFIGKLTTDGAKVTAFEDLRKEAPVSTLQINPDSIKPARVDVSAFSGFTDGVLLNSTFRSKVVLK